MATHLELEHLPNACSRQWQVDVRFSTTQIRLSTHRLDMYTIVRLYSGPNAAGLLTAHLEDTKYHHDPVSASRPSSTY
jgi:hypothetical protein